ncbi:MAG: carboxypeptidase regulatory-like domain-containing protein [Gemmatimonadales bacterium]
MVLVVLLAALATTAVGQSLTAGTLRGSVRTLEGGGLGGVVITLERADGGTSRFLESEDDGSFELRMLQPGQYRVLFELPGYQPVRRTGIVVASGRVTTVSVSLERRPPPITAPTEVDGAAATSGGPVRLVSGFELERLDYRRDGTDLSRGASEVDPARDGRSGFAHSAGGLPGTYSRLFVDGFPELLLRHPGLPAEPAQAPSFARDGLAQGQIIGRATDAEWRGVPGTVLGLETKRGSNRIRFSPYATYSAAGIGGRGVQNPSDSSGNSFQVGASLGGSLVPDTAHFLLRADYQSLMIPSAFAWENDTAAVGGQPTSIREAILAAGDDTFGRSLAGALAPPVRTWKGGTASGRVDWQMSPRHGLMARAGFASWKERNPLLGADLSGGIGSALDARDISGAIAVTSMGSRVANEVRAGFASSRRDWTGPAIPLTTFVAEGVAIGGSGALPAAFDRRIVSVSDAFQYRGGRHLLKLGANADFNSHEQDYRYGAAGVFHFGDLTRFGQAEGTWFQTLATAPSTRFSTVDAGLFLEDTWSVAPGVQLLLGLRYETQSLPENRITLNQDWLDASGLRNDSIPRDRRGVSPRVGFSWDVQERGEWMVQGSGGLYYSGLDLATFAEAVLHDGGVTVRRGQGTFTGWPSSSGGPVQDAGARLTMFTSSYRAPRTLKGELGVTRAAGGLLVRVGGSYNHTDYLLRRNDLNRPGDPLATTQEGRPVYGLLAKQGGLVAPVPESNRRFTDFDMVSALTPTGFSDHYELTAAVERRVVRAVSVIASYTYSRTRDNLVGALAQDPADQLSPFPTGLDGADWDEGRSDLDVPHRLAGTITYHGEGRTPITLGARARWRSGLPFTPGFRPGVDLNGDGGGGNDPVEAETLGGLTGDHASCAGGSVGGFAERNACREKGVGALDLHAAVSLAVGGAGSRLAVTVDAFNVVASATGLVDRAALLVDPAGSLSTSAGGTVTVPLVANPRFGSLLSRRGEPRIVRFGLRVEY